MSVVKMLDIDAACCNKSKQCVPEFISEISDNKLYSDFFREFMIENIPCIIKEVALHWKCSSQWVFNGKPDFRNLASTYGSCMVPVTDCKKPEKCKRYILFKEYLDYIEGKTLEKSVESILYLKDWHLRRENPQDTFYSVPKYFASDWLNEYSVDNNKDDYMFVYFGPKGSWTPFHADVYTSFSWSANIIGKKKWLLFPPGEELKLIDVFGNLPNSVEDLLNNNHTYFEVIQDAGDAIFIPSGWYHQVYNLEDTISVNHNWVNGCNVDIMWKSLKSNLEMVEKEIIEFKDTEGWTEHCQVMLQSLFGMNYSDFFDFVKYIAEKRLKSLKNENNISFENWNLSDNHVIFDLKSLKYVLESLQTQPYLDKKNIIELEQLLHNIHEILSLEIK